VRVDYYGVETPLTQIASVVIGGCPHPADQPVEKNLVPVVEKAIMAANLASPPTPPAPPSASNCRR